MRCDKEIFRLVGDIKRECDDYLDYVISLNENAYSDRQLEGIIEKSKELDKIHNDRFEKNSSNKDSMER